MVEKRTHGFRIDRNLIELAARGTSVKVAAARLNTTPTGIIKKARKLGVTVVDGTLRKRYVPTRADGVTKESET